MIYNFDPVNPAEITRMPFGVLGTSDQEIRITNAKVGFYGSANFEVWDAETGGNQLVEDVDYQILYQDAEYSSLAGSPVYTGFKMLTHTAVSVWATFKVVLSYIDADVMNFLIDTGVYPKGIPFFQLPGLAEPETIFGGDWLNISNQFPARFLRIEGTDGNHVANAFNGGTQQDQFQAFQVGAKQDYSGARNIFGVAGPRGYQSANGASDPNQSVPVFSTAGQSISGLIPVSNGTHGTSRTGYTTYPVNDTIRVWKRI